jgi:tRNA dimethylallyltransferase
MINYKDKIYIIIGPTSSGKTAASIELAKQINGEIISADSRQIYKDFDLLSGKITKSEMQNIEHYMLDIATPGITYTAAEYVKDALKAIEKIQSKNKKVIICGGNGLYIDALLYDYSMPAVERDIPLRDILKVKTIEELQNIISYLDPVFAAQMSSSTKNNRHRLERLIEVASKLGTVPEPQKVKRFTDVEFIFTDLPKEILQQKVYDRILQRFDAGMIDELKNVKEKYNLSSEYLESLGLEFKYISRYLDSKLTKDEMIKEIYHEHLRYIKRQNTWFKRYKNY